ncbi:hypothetical protein [Acidovorax sp. A1169]|uniref:hypothetical protein n=1 Tax=Acidovorax sp. A1169 TaxID=3059524 RepID=UPI002737BF79|nr:hypothetical protein [Acidovorax sp. A1169]MDP4075832.1 hypothetical protein [Acidovorax sp. A1169]
MIPPLFSRKSLAAMALLSLAAVSAQAQDVLISDPPQDHTFGKAALNSTFATQYFSVFNRSSAAVQLGAAGVDSALATCAALGCPTIAPADFTIPGGSDGCSNAVLQPGQGCSTLVIFSPKQPGSRVARLVFPVRGATAVTRTVTGTGLAQPTDCVLDWAENSFRSILTSPTSTITAPPFYLRCYANGAICLGADAAVQSLDQPSVYIYQPQATPAIQRLGFLSTFAQAAQCP